MPLMRSFREIPVTGWLILVLTLGISALSGLWTLEFLSARDKQEQQFAASQVTEKINERLSSYALLLRSSAGLFAGANRVKREDWRRYIDKLGGSDAVSGVVGFGFAVVVTPDQLDAHQQRMVREGFEDYQVYPPGPRDLYTAIVFLEPRSPENLPVMGYDMYSEPTRRAAMDQARDTGQPALTSKLALQRDPEASISPGILIYVPVYRNNTNPETLELRRQTLAAWVYGAFQVTTMLEGILEDWATPSGVRRAIGVRIYDQTPGEENLLFSNLPAQIDVDPELDHQISFNGHTWVLRFAPRGSTALRYGVTVILTTLAVLALGLLILFLYLSLRRTRDKANAIAEGLTRDLRDLAYQFDTIASRVPGIVYTFQRFPDGRFCFPYASRGLKDLFDIDPEDVKENAELAFNAIHPADTERVLRSIEVSATNLSIWDEEFRVLHTDGRIHWMLGNGLPQLNDDGSVLWYGSLTRITERKDAELRLQQALTEASRFRDALDRMDTFVFMKDMSLRYIYANNAILNRFGLSRHELIGTQAEQVLDTASLRRINAQDTRVLLGAKVTEEAELNIRGEPAILLQIKTPIYEHGNSDRIVGLIGISTDITKAKQQAREIERLAHYDALTGLPNRALLTDRLQQAIAMVDRRQSSLAVVYLDLDGFKAVNDTYGHSVGDQVLITIARRLREVLREEDTLSRLGGDELVAVLIDASADTDYQAHLERLLEAVARPILIKDNPIEVSASLGVTFYPQPEVSGGDQLIRQADQAMYHAKLSGKNRYHLFDTELDRSMRSQHETIEHMRQALANDELRLYFQPKVNMRTSEIIGAEALLRWEHPERGLLSPGAFINVVEHTPLMIDIGHWVLDQALQQMFNWLQQGIRVPVSINVSAVELHSAGFVGRLTECLRAWPGVEPGMLELEVLETAALGDLGQIARVLDECRQLGVSVAIDDFGTGYSSLTYFKRLPAKVVKIDQSFVRGILVDPADLAILDGIIRLADALDRYVVAEGVETHKHAEMLLRIGCELAQGYGIARPMPARDFLSWREHWQAPASWRSLRSVSRRALPGLYARVDHQAWMERFRSYLAGDGDPVELDHEACGFGTWLNQQALNKPGMPPIARLHEEIHRVATDIDQLYRKGQKGQIPALMQALDILSEQLLNEMEELIESYH